MIRSALFAALLALALTACSQKEETNTNVETPATPAAETPVEAAPAEPAPAEEAPAEAPTEEAPAN